MVKLIECPRDAMQGIEKFIPTNEKAAYLNQLLQVGFDTLDFGSFVSPKAIPQLADTSQVLDQLDLSNTTTNLLAIIANKRGAEEASNYKQITFLGYPFSVSETFQKRNTNATIEESLSRVEEIQTICLKKNKRLVLYLSMAFGNPYGDAFHEDLVADWIYRLGGLDISIFALSDTIGVSEEKIIGNLFGTVIKEFPNYEIGAHFHTRPDEWKEKVAAAYEQGCRRFDGAIAGYGGCPMAEDELTGNMAMENLIAYFTEVNDVPSLDMDAFARAQAMASAVFP